MNCFNCKHKVLVHLGIDNVSSMNLSDHVVVDENRLGRCLKGFNQRLVTFWVDNGTKPFSELGKVKMDCHEYNDWEKKLIGIDNKLDEFIEKFNNGSSK